MVLLTGADQFWNDQLVAVGANVVHQSLGLVFCVKDTQVCIDTIVGALEGHSLLQESHQFFLIAEALVKLDNFFEVVWVDNDVLATQAGHAEFLSANTSEANCFPNFGYVHFFGGVKCSLVFLKLDVGLSQFLIVVDAFEKDFASKIQSLVEATVTTLLYVSLVRI